MNDTEIQRLACMANALRPDWPVPSLRTWLTRSHAHRAYRDVAVALAHIAADEKTRTPKRMDEAGPWWPSDAGSRLIPPGPPRFTQVDFGRPQPPETAKRGAQRARQLLRQRPEGDA